MSEYRSMMPRVRQKLGSIGKNTKVAVAETGAKIHRDLVLRLPESMRPHVVTLSQTRVVRRGNDFATPRYGGGLLSIGVQLPWFPIFRDGLYPNPAQRHWNPDPIGIDPIPTQSLSRSNERGKGYMVQRTIEDGHSHLAQEDVTNGMQNVATIYLKGRIRYHANNV